MITGSGSFVLGGGLLPCWSFSVVAAFGISEGVAGILLDGVATTSGFIGCLPWGWWRCLYDGQEHSKEERLHRGESLERYRSDHFSVFGVAVGPNHQDTEPASVTPCAVTTACLLWCTSIAAVIRSSNPVKPVKSIFAAFSRTCCDKICLLKYRDESALLSGLNVFPPRLRFLIASAKQSSIADLFAPAFNGVNTMYRFPAI